MHLKINGLESISKSLDSLLEEKLQASAKMLYEDLRSKVPEVENEKQNFSVNFDGIKLRSDISKFSKELQEKINSYSGSS